SEVPMLAIVFVLIAVAVRLIPHTFSVTPVAAALLFFGAKGSKKLAWLPVLLLIGSDIYLSKVQYGVPLSADLLVSWAWYAGIIGLGMLLRRNQASARIFGASVAAAVSFFLLSNFAVWAVWQMYPKTVAGLMTCYTVGLPFFQREVLGDVVFTAVMFAIPAAIAALKAQHANQAA
ncbi:MAG: DUF6580 family putative transport protein, partial [Terriglobales bacterium]